MRKFLNIFLILFALVLSSCAESEENMNNNSNDKTCLPLEEVFDLSKNDDYKLITIPDASSGTVVNKGIMQWITDRVTEVITDATETIYEEISDDEEFRAILGLLVTLTIMFYALSIMLGISQASGYAALIFFIKIILVYNFAANWDLFNTYVVEVFEAFVNDTVKFAAGTFHDYQAFDNDPATGDASIFAEIDKMLSIFWDFRIAKIVLAFMFTGITGFFWGLMILMFMFMYLMAVIMAVKTYLFALLARHVLYALGPIFLSFALFNQTKSLFDGYVEQIINFALQPVFLFIFLGLFHMVLVGFVKEIYLDNLTDVSKYVGGGSTGSAPKPCVKYTEFGEFMGQKLHFYKLCIRTNPTDEGCEDSSDLKPTIPINIWVLISAIIVCYLMYSMTSWVVVVATRLSSGYVNISDIPIEGFGRFQGALGQGAKKMFSTAGGGGRAGPPGGGSAPR